DLAGLVLACRFDDAVLDYEDRVGGITALRDRVAALVELELRAATELCSRGVAEQAHVAVRAHVRRDRATVIDALEVLAHALVAAREQIEPMLLDLEEDNRRFGRHRRSAFAAAEQRGLAEEVARAIEAAERDALIVEADGVDHDRALHQDE